MNITMHKTYFSLFLFIFRMIGVVISTGNGSVLNEEKLDIQWMICQSYCFQLNA